VEGGLPETAQGGTLRQFRFLIGGEMSYENAKEALRKNLMVILRERTSTVQDYLIYDLATSLFHLIEALQSDLAEIKEKLDRLGGDQRPPQ
jgi:hypothetical protein